MRMHWHCWACWLGWQSARGRLDGLGEDPLLNLSMYSPWTSVKAEVSFRSCELLSLCSSMKQREGRTGSGSSNVSFGW